MVPSLPVPIEPVDANAHTEDASGAPTLATPGLGGDDAVVAGTERYEFGTEVARGGMGRIVRAVDRRLGRDVAVKVMIGSSGQLAARFDREARVIARLQHPGIVPIYDIGSTEDGRPFYSMKLIEGRTLDDAIKAADADGRMELLPHVLAAVDAIAYAHSQRIIHRDLKPLNVLVGAFGETLVIDWGLAKELTALTGDSGEEPIPAADDPTLTRHGQVVGTPAYMPPEQAAGRPVDERADVYALGAMLYHVLAGQPPFAGVASERLMAEVVGGRPRPLDQLRPDLPDDLLAIVARAMARAPLDRYADAQEMAADLRRHQAGQLVSAHRYTLRQRLARFIRRNRDAVIAVTMMGIAGAALLGYQYKQVLDERDQARAAEAEAVRLRDGAEGMAEYMVDDLRDKLEPIGKLSLLDDIGIRVDAYYRDVDARPSDLSRRAHAVALRADVAGSKGDSRRSLALYQEAIMLAAASGDVAELAQDMLSLGAVLFEQGQHDAAERWFQLAHDLPVPKVQAVALIRLGMLAAVRGENDLALQRWRDAGARFAALPRDQLATAKDRYFEAVVHGMIADMLWQKNQVDETRRELAASRTIIEGIIADFPDDLQWLRARSLTLDRMAEMERYVGDFDAARRLFEASQVIAEKLAAHDPDNAEWQQDLVLSLRNLGGLDLEQERYADAVARLKRALSIQERQVASDPDNLDAHQVLSSVQIRLATVQKFAGQKREAEASMRKAIELRRAEIARAPGDLEVRYRLAEALVHLGWQFDMVTAKEGLALAREARALIAQQAAEDPSYAEWPRTLAMTELAIARWLDRIGSDRAEVRAHAARALPALERLQAENVLTSHEQQWVGMARKLAR
jgi:tetratricopeptide (TPR) repeat protein